MPPRNPEQRQQVLDLDARGVPCREIARQLGANSGTVWRIINGQGNIGGGRKKKQLCPECGGVMLLDAKLDATCGDCGHRITRWQRMPEGRKALARVHSARWRHKQKALLRGIVRAAKSAPCVDCGGSWPYYVMQFDHVRGRKLFGIATVISRVGSVGEAKLRAEIAKCDVVCANCHALRHAGVYVQREAA